MSKKVLKEHEYIVADSLDGQSVIAVLHLLSGPVLSFVLNSWLPGLAILLATIMLQLFIYSRLEPYENGDTV